MCIIFWFCIGVIIGAVIGTLSTRQYMHSRAKGNLVIANDPVDKQDYIFLEMNRWSMEELKGNQTVELSVVDRTHKTQRL